MEPQRRPEGSTTGRQPDSSTPPVPARPAQNLSPSARWRLGLVDTDQLGHEASSEKARLQPFGSGRRRCYDPARMNLAQVARILSGFVLFLSVFELIPLSVAITESEGTASTPLAASPSRSRRARRGRPALARWPRREGLRLLPP
jgi:hypothetical protein